MLKNGKKIFIWVMQLKVLVYVRHQMKLLKKYQQVTHMKAKETTTTTIIIYNKEKRNNSKEAAISKKPVDQSGYAGLLRRHKTIDEFGSGFDTSKKFPKKIKNPTARKNKLSLADRLKPVSKDTKTKSKRDMSIFE